MKFTDHYDIDFFIHRWKEKITMKIVWALPRYFVCWCVIRVWATITSGNGKYSNLNPTSVMVCDALDAWRKSYVTFTTKRRNLSLESLDKIANYNQKDWEIEINEKMVKINIWSGYDSNIMEPFFEYIGVSSKKFKKKVVDAAA